MLHAALLATSLLSAEPISDIYPLPERAAGIEIVREGGTDRRLEVVERCRKVALPKTPAPVVEAPKEPPKLVVRQERIPKYKPRQAALVRANRRVRAVVLGLDARKVETARPGLAPPAAPPAPVEAPPAFEWVCETEYAGGSPPPYGAVYREDSKGRWQVAFIQGGQRHDVTPPFLVVPVDALPHDTDCKGRCAPIEHAWQATFKKDGIFNEFSGKVVRPTTAEAQHCERPMALERTISTDHGTDVTVRELFCRGRGRSTSTFMLTMGKSVLSDSQLTFGGPRD